MRSLVSLAVSNFSWAKAGAVPSRPHPKRTTSTTRIQIDEYRPSKDLPFNRSPHATPLYRLCRTIQQRKITSPAETCSFVHEPGVGIRAGQACLKEEKQGVGRDVKIEIHEAVYQ